MQFRSGIAVSAKQLSALDVLQAKVCRAFLRKKAVQFDTHETKENLNKLCFLESLHYRRQHISLVLLFKYVKGEVKAKIKISPVVVFGVLSRMVVVRGS